MSVPSTCPACGEALSALSCPCGWVLAGVLDVEAARKRCDRASPGPWRAQGNMFTTSVCCWIGEGRYPENHNDAAFIAAARTDLPIAIDALIRLTAEVADLTEALSEASGMVEYLDGRVHELEAERA